VADFGGAMQLFAITFRSEMAHILFSVLQRFVPRRSQPQETSPLVGEVASNARRWGGPKGRWEKVESRRGSIAEVYIPLSLLSVLVGPPTARITRTSPTRGEVLRALTWE
jgi:hypothetical protein